MGNTDSTENNTDITNNNTTNIQNTTNITENNYNTYCFINGSKDSSVEEGYKRFFEIKQQYLDAIKDKDEGVKVQQQREKIAAYIEDSLKTGLGIDKMTNMFKQLNAVNQLALNENLFNEVYADYFITPRKKISELEQKLTQQETTIQKFTQQETTLQQLLQQVTQLQEQYKQLQQAHVQELTQQQQLQQTLQQLQTQQPPQPQPPAEQPPAQ